MMAIRPGILQPIERWGRPCASCLYAADHGGLEPLALMLDKGYPIESKNSKGETALMLAASVGYVDCVKLLVQKGANVNATDSEGNTPLSLALKSPSAETVKVLQDAGAK